MNIAQVNPGRRSFLYFPLRPRIHPFAAALFPLYRPVKVVPDQPGRSRSTALAQTETCRLTRSPIAPPCKCHSRHPQPGEQAKTTACNPCPCLNGCNHPWSRMTDEERVGAVRSLFPNPPFPITIQGIEFKEIQSGEEFSQEIEDGWVDSDHVRQINVSLHFPDLRISGQAAVRYP